MVRSSSFKRPKCRNGQVLNKKSTKFWNPNRDELRQWFSFYSVSSEASDAATTYQKKLCIPFHHRVNGTLKAKINKICKSAELGKCITTGTNANRTTHLTLRAMLTGRPMPAPNMRNLHFGKGKKIIH